MRKIALLFFLTGVFAIGALRAEVVYGAGKGSLTNLGGMWGWTGTNEAFVPQLVMYADVPRYYNNPGKIDADIQTFIKGHGFSGFHVGVACRWFDLNEKDCRNISGSNPLPDQRTIDALKMLIQKTHAAGGMVHIWMWGDAERGQNPSVRSDWGGLMGSVDKRLQDKIAQELGSLDGWSMGYGFDLDEWVGASKLKQWRDYLQGRLPKFHFLGGRPAGPNSGTNHSAFVSWNKPMDYSSYEHHRPTYNVYVAALSAVSGQPVMSEDRFRVRSGGRSKDYNLDDTRRGLWTSTLAGGVANIWGYLKDGGSHDAGSAPYPNKNQIKTYSRFFEDRFKKDMSRCGSLTSGGARCLKRSNNRDYVFYRESTSSIQMDLSGMSGSQPAVAVDTKKTYGEIDLGALQAKNQTWNAPYSSDWAIAVGSFGGVVPPPSLTPTPTGQVSPTPPSDGWIFCVNEHGFCSFSGTKEVRYGANGFYRYLVLSNGTDCTNAVFGDPIKGVFKQCHYRDVTTVSPSPIPKQGDIDNDGDVDIFDYNILIENFAKTNCGNVADINSDCKVDIFDYNILVENFGRKQ